MQDRERQKLYTEFEFGRSVQGFMGRHAAIPDMIG
jgi:hypothetical protein